MAKHNNYSDIATEFSGVIFSKIYKGKTTSEFGNGSNIDTVLEIVSKIRQRDREGIVAVVESWQDQLPPFNADPQNPLKHAYQNQGYRQAQDDILAILKSI